MNLHSPACTRSVDSTQTSLAVPPCTTAIEKPVSAAAAAVRPDLIAARPPIALRTPLAARPADPGTAGPGMVGPGIVGPGIADPGIADLRIAGPQTRRLAAGPVAVDLPSVAADLRSADSAADRRIATGPVPAAASACRAGP